MKKKQAILPAGKFTDGGGFTDPYGGPSYYMSEKKSEIWRTNFLKTKTRNKFLEKLKSLWFKIIK